VADRYAATHWLRITDVVFQTNPYATQKYGLAHETNSSRNPDRVGAAIILHEDGNGASFRNVVFLRNIRQWTKSKNKILSSAIH
jgi:hypothetical protein